MSKSASTDRMSSSIGAAPKGAIACRLGPLDVLALSAWCGLAAGWFEVASRIVCRWIGATNQLYMMSSHFVWLVPLTDALLFTGIGVVLAVATKLWPRRGAWIGPRILCAAAPLPALLVAGPQIYSGAWLILTFGIAVRVVPRLERSAARLRRGLALTLPVVLGSVLAAAGFVIGRDRLKEWREAGRPLPAARAPNVLLIVLDTVRADRLSLYGYHRATSPALDRLAQRGIRFDEARAASSWTLPSHASFFTGRWPHELHAKWLTPLRATFPTLAEYLGSHGYATAGFVANTQYCSYDTGMDRGFAHYEDYVLDFRRLRPFRMALLFDRAWDGVSKLGLWLFRSLQSGRTPPWQQAVLRWLLATGRKDAATINREFLEWLSRRSQPDRPFFAFLNYFDAHAPYLPPEGSPFPFGLRPQTDADFILLAELWTAVDKLRLLPRYRRLAHDSYDNCIAYLDARVGELLDDLERRGLLDRTLLVVTSDHGEELGEHALFDHGESLYRPEIRVPLLIVGPGASRSPRVVRQAVSLRDLPATIVDVVGLADGSPFPGRSLAGLAPDSPASVGRGAYTVDGALSELAEPNPASPSQGRSPAARGSLVALARGDYVYIRNEGDGREELFNERDDPQELVNQAGFEAMQPILREFRERLRRVNGSGD
jgi:arylsulfatase A-like enzyme